MNLSIKQQEIITSPEQKIVVIASAAAGKTTVLKERINYLLEQQIDPTKIVAITFTNAAAEELSTRLGEKATGIFIGTIHSYANYLLRKIGCGTTEAIQNEQFDKLFKMVADKPNCVEEVDYLLLDEAQDSNEEQFTFILDIVKPKNYMFVGDFRQSIYRWNGACPDFLMGLRNSPDVKTYDLNENYRNGYKILDFAKGLIRLCGKDYRDTSICMSPEQGKVLNVLYAPDRIVETIKKKGDYKNWFILTRSNAELENMTSVFQRNNVPYDTFKKAELNNNDLKKKLDENTVKVLTIHTAKGLEADNVVVIGANCHGIEETCISYVAATRARKLLVWVKYPAKSKKKDYEIW